MVLCSKLRRSNIRTLPSAPQLTKTSTLLAQNLTSNTSLSCAINCVFAVSVGMSQIVQVVSMLDVIIRLGETVFQSREVKGAVCSGVLEFDNKAKGVSLLAGPSRPTFADRVMEFPGDDIADSEGRLQSLRWSPDVASRSVDCFWEDGGSHNRRVTGYECVASAIFTNSNPYFGPPGVYDSAGVGVICESNI
jgi:hypothetical protein